LSELHKEGVTTHGHLRCAQHVDGSCATFWRVNKSYVL